LRLLAVQLPSLILLLHDTNPLQKYLFSPQSLI
jgi:hypothetical protein